MVGAGGGAVELVASTDTGARKGTVVVLPAEELEVGGSVVVLLVRVASDDELELVETDKELEDAEVIEDVKELDSVAEEDKDVEYAVDVASTAQYDWLRLETTTVPETTTSKSPDGSPLFIISTRLPILISRLGGALVEQSPTGALLYATMIEFGGGTGL